MTQARAVGLVVAATVASYGLGAWLAVPWLLPVLNAAVAWWVMAVLLRAGRLRDAIAVMLVWAAVMGLTSTTMAALGWVRPHDGDSLFLRPGYRDEMIAWVRTGDGAESQPRVFVPRHAAQAAVFSLTAGATGGLAAMPMGAVLTNSMGDYVGAMAAGSDRPLVSAVLGWHPWAVVRIVGFVILGVTLSGVVLSRLFAFPFDLRAHRRWVLAGAGLLVLDVMLKALLAPAWGRMLRGVAGW